jgi:hypothetical protein
VRQHHRNTGDVARDGWARRVEASAAPPPHVSVIAPAAEAGPPGDFWDAEEPPSPAFTDMQQEMRDWRALGEPDLPELEPMDPGMASLLGADTPEGALKLRRLKAYRDAGYTGPLDPENNIPDPDDPENWVWMRAGAAMRG